MTDKRRGAAVRVAYGSPAIGRAFLLIPVLTILPSVYVQDYGMTSGLVATIILLTRLFDLALDPLVGFLSDRFVHRVKRTSLMLGGLPFLTLGALLAYGPLARSPAVALVGLATLLLGWTLIEVPHRALAVDAQSTNEGRVAYFAAREAVAFASTILATTLLLGLSLSDGAGTQLALQVLGLVLIAATGIAVFWCRTALHEKPSTEDRGSGNPVDLPKSARFVVAQWRFLLGVFAFAAAAGIGASLHLVTCRVIFGDGALLAPILFIEAATGIVTAVFAKRVLAGPYAAKSVWLCCILCAVLTASIFFVAMRSLAMSVALISLRSIPLALVLISIWSRMGSLSNHFRTTMRSEAAGTIAGATGALAKTGLVLGPPFAFFLLSQSGAGDEIEPGSLLFVYSLLPAFIFTLSAPLLGHPSVYEGQQNMTSTERFS